MKALSVRQPWAWLIIHAGKDIENRSWKSFYRGPLIIHASRTMGLADYNAAMRFLADDCFAHITLPSPGQLERGGIIGRVNMIECLEDDDSPWFCGPFGFVLRNPEPFPFIPVKGALSFFDIPENPFYKFSPSPLFPLLPSVQSPSL